MCFSVAMFNVVNAETFTYKVYDHQLNKSYIVELGTIGVTDTQYMYAFFNDRTKPPICVAMFNDNTDTQGFVNGKCMKYSNLNEFMSWKELSKNTFNYDIARIYNLRSKQGLHEYNDISYKPIQRPLHEQIGVSKKCLDNWRTIIEAEGYVSKDTLQYLKHSCSDSENQKMMNYSGDLF